MSISGLIDTATDSIHDASCLHNKSISIFQNQYRLCLDFIFALLSFIYYHNLIYIPHNQDDSTVNAKVSVPATAGGLILGAYIYNSLVAP